MAKITINRTATPGLAPTGLLEGELAVEMAPPVKLWVGVPLTLDPSGRKLLIDTTVSAGVHVGEVPQTSPVNGSLWYESDTGVLWIYYNDGTSIQWVQLNGISTAGLSGSENFVAKTGDTMTGWLEIDVAGQAALILNHTAAGGNNAILGKKGGLTRWSVEFGDTAPETGGDVGSDFRINSYGDTGVAKVTPLVISRATGYVTFNTPTFVKGTTGTSYLAMDCAPGGVNQFDGLKSGVSRWTMRLGDGVAESGNNLGSNFQLAATLDDGATQRTALYIHRDSMNAAFTSRVDVTRTLGIGSPDSCAIIMQKGSGAFNNVIAGYTGNQVRWTMELGDTQAETGGDTGSNFRLATTRDNGTGINVLVFDRHFGHASFGAGVYCKDTLTITGAHAGAEPYISITDMNANPWWNISTRQADNTLNFVSRNAAGWVQFGPLGLISASYGYAVKAGVSGAVGGSVHNTNWTAATGGVEGWIDFSRMGLITYSSDYRIKTNMVTLDSMWDRVKALRPISYTRKDFTPEGRAEPLFTANDKIRWGFVAHELQEALIEDAATGVKDDPVDVQSPNPWTVIAALTKALQEAMERIEALEAAPVTRKK